jgi:hypothetical protein
MYVAAPVNLESPPCQESPELQLWRQVLLHAIKDCRGPSAGVKPHDKGSVQRRARAWVFSKSDDPGSFKWCCEVLALDPRAVDRQALLTRCEWKPGLSPATIKPVKASRKTRIDKHERLGDCLAPFEVQNFLISPTDSRSPSNSSDGHHLCFGRSGWRPKRESLSLKTLMTSGL